VDPELDGVVLHEQALAAMDECRFADAVGLCRRAIEALSADGGPGQPDVANVLTVLATAEDELGRHDAAQRHHRRSLAVLAAVPGSGGDLTRLLVQARVGLAGSLRRQGRYDEAEVAYGQALAPAGHGAAGPGGVLSVTRARLGRSPPSAAPPLPAGLPRPVAVLTAGVASVTTSIRSATPTSVQAKSVSGRSHNRQSRPPSPARAGSTSAGAASGRTVTDSSNGMP
jgi:Tetratricopeptide repeat